MSHIKPCPRCQSPLQIPEPVPQQIRCSGCGAVIKRKPAPVDAVRAATPPPLEEEPRSAAETPHSRTLILGIAGGLGAVGVLLVVVVILALNSGRETKASPEEELLAKLTAAPIQEPPRPPVTENKKEGPPKSVDPPKSVEPPPLPPGIREAVDRGAAYLKKRLREETRFDRPLYEQFGDDSTVGAIALAGLTLLEARVPPDDPVIRKALDRVRAAGDRLHMVYTLGAALFFLNRLHDIQPLSDSDRALTRSLALRLLAGQLAEGRWTYANRPLSPQAEQALIEKLRTNTYEPSNLNPSHPASNSMTQFALLALWGSRRHDLPIRQAFLLSARRFQLTQYPEGTWGYQRNDLGKAYCDSNTCAGLLALAMEKTLREDPQFKGGAVNDPPANPKADEQCAKAFEHLAKVIGRTKNDPAAATATGSIIRADAWGDYYFLWCLERVAVIYDLKTIGGKDWYAWGSEVILQNQHADGSWRDIHGEVADTCFALLFLTRANLAKDLTESIRKRAKDL